MTKHVAVVGAGLGGLRVAEQLRAAGHVVSTHESSVARVPSGTIPTGS